MKKLFKYIFITAVCSFIFIVPALAQGGLGNATALLQNTGEKAGVQGEDVGSVVGTFINVALTMVGLIFLVLMVYAGYMWMTARGEESKVEKAQDIIRAAIIGLIIVMSAYAITTLVTNRFS
ncbi:MAG: hypothetical protein HOG08_00640 [Candidatus Magasanikbacteria bacterium]|nr:hypothetical protein [Candidatus Magasanikbacteria bacterium]